MRMHIEMQQIAWNRKQNYRKVRVNCIAPGFIEGNTLDFIFNATKESWIIVIYLAVGMNLIGYSCWYSVLSRNPVNNVMSVLLLFPITGLLTSIFILKETPNVYAYVGGAIIISGVAMILINKRIKNHL